MKNEVAHEVRNAVVKIKGLIREIDKELSRIDKALDKFKERR